MNKTLYQLAYRNIKKHKKHYTFMTIFIFFITIFFQCFIIVQESSYLITKQYNEEHYGTWFMSVEFSPETREIIENKVKENLNQVTYGEWYDQGIIEEDIEVGYLSKELYDICHLPLIEGRLPQKNNEIVLDKTYFQDKKYQLNQIIELTLNEKTTSYQIVGVVEKSQDIFPDIYTNDNSFGITYFVFDRSFAVIISEGDRDYMTIHANDQDYNISVSSYNQFGYNHNPQLEKYQLTLNNVLVLSEVMIICVLVLFAMTSTSLKRRTKEFALLRGIGMTTRQILLSLFYENMLIGFLAVILGTIISPLLSYAITYVISLSKDIFIFQWSIIDLIINVCIVLSVVMIASLYPTLQSARTALSGSFDSYHFRYIQVRYRKLKKQNSFRLALREMKVYKRMTIFLFIVFGLCNYMIITQTVSRYEPVPKIKTFEAKIINWNTSNKDVIYKLHKNNIGEKYQFYTNKYNVEIQYSTQYYTPTGEIRLYDALYQIDNSSLFDDCEMYGRLPQNKNEALVVPPLSLEEIQFHEIDGEMIEAGNTLVNLVLGTNFTLGKNEVEIVGVLKPLEILEFRNFDNSTDTVELYQFPLGLYVLPDLYEESVNRKEDSIYYQEFYETEEELQNIIKTITLCGVEDYSVINKIEYSIGIDMNFSEIFFEIPMSTLILGIIMSVIVCYFINKNETLNNKNDYALYRLIGMTKKDILKKQICKAFIMTISIFVFETFFICIYSLYLNTFVDPFVEIIISLIGTFVLSVCVYCLPLISLLKNNAIDMLNKSE